MSYLRAAYDRRTRRRRKARRRAKKVEPKAKPAPDLSGLFAPVAVSGPVLAPEPEPETAPSYDYHLTMTKREICAELDTFGVEYDGRAKKADLAALLEAALYDDDSG